jgi:hypothetical protein
MKMRVVVEVFNDSGESAFKEEAAFDVSRRASGLIEAVSGSAASASFVGKSIITEAARIASGVVRSNDGGGSSLKSPDLSGPISDARDAVIRSVMPDMRAILMDEQRSGSGSGERPPIRREMISADDGKPKT